MTQFKQESQMMETGRNVPKIKTYTNLYMDVSFLYNHQCFFLPPNLKLKQKQSCLLQVKVKNLNTSSTAAR